MPQFHQVEGLVVDKGISFGDLKGTLDYFCKQMFGPDRKTRFRAHYFPFTEPSAEADVSCGVCGGSGHLPQRREVPHVQGHGWLEILGCGMVDPNVYGFVDIDPEEYSGFAFGMGVERIACLKYNVPDLRMLLEGDMRFLRQVLKILILKLTADAAVFRGTAALRLSGLPSRNEVRSAARHLNSAHHKSPR